MVSPRRWPFEPGDCLQQYLNATAALIGCNVSSLADHIGADLWHAHDGPTYMHAERLVQALSEFAGIPPALLRQGQLQTHYGASLLPWSLARPTWTRDRVDLGHPRMCLACLAERPWAIRTVWRMPIIRVCTVHEQALVRRCPRCGALLRAIRKSRPADPVSTRCDGCGTSHERLVATVPTASDDLVRRTGQLLNDLAAQSAGDIGQWDLAAVQDLSFVISESRITSRSNAKSLFTLSESPIDSCLTEAMALGRASRPRASSRPLEGCDIDSLRTLVRGRRGALRAPAVNAALIELELRGNPWRPSKSFIADRWPQLVPPAIFRFACADLLYDLLANSVGQVDWHEARAVAAVLTVAEQFALTHRSAATSLGLSFAIAGTAEQVVREARTSDRADVLRDACASTANLIDKCWIGRGAIAAAHLRAAREVHDHHPGTLVSGNAATEVLCRAPRAFAA